MRIRFNKFIKIVLTVLTASGLTLFLNYANYKRYYASIAIIQTVDFNILSAILPTKLSSLLIIDNQKEIYRILNSNYGLFGMIITDCKKEKNECPQQKILFATDSWYKEYTLNDLVNAPYDLLRNPPPLLTEKLYPIPSAIERESTDEINTGEIIGRVYYVRREFPSFFISQRTWLKNPFSTKDVKSLYSLTFLVMSIGAGLIYLLLERKELQNKVAEQEYQQKLLEKENELLRFKTFNDAFEQVIEQDFSSVIANRLQELDSLLKNILIRIDSDAQNIVHDIYKAPLLFNPDVVPKYIHKLEENKEQGNISDELIELLKNLDQTIKTLKWVVEELRGITRIQSEPTIVQKQIKNLQEHLPPSVQDWKINFIYPDNNLWIDCNPWHLKSIIKNALYNSSAALKKYRRQLKRKGVAFEGEITVRCESNNDSVIIQVEDNGSGIPEHILPSLYETSERLNQSAGSLKGNGSIIISAYLSLHNGKVEKLNLDQGARISFIFPMRKQED